MLDAGLLDNDVVVVDRDAKPANGRIVIAIVDTGYVQHYDLAENLLPGFDFIADGTNAEDGDGCGSENESA